MNIYFAGSIRGGRSPENVEAFNRIIDVLKHYGTVLTEHIGDKKITFISRVGETLACLKTRDTSTMDTPDVSRVVA